LRRLAPLVACALALAGCVGGGTESATWCRESTGSCSVSGYYALRGDSPNGTGSQSQAWQNERGAVRLVWAGEVEEGALVVRVLDSEGKLVLAQHVDAGTPAGYAVTGEGGAPGKWRVETTWSGFRGDLGLVLEAR
jgi:hypothetical protein